MLAYLSPLLIALAWGLARTASASCEVVLDGDPEIVDDVQAALFTFGRDDVPCVALRALCSRDASDLVIDLRDQLGRSVQRRFTTAVGAAAFLISWSRRPLPEEGTDLAPPPGAPAPHGNRRTRPAEAPSGRPTAPLSSEASSAAGTGTRLAAPAAPLSPEGPDAASAGTRLAAPRISPPGMTLNIQASDTPVPRPAGLLAVDGWHPEIRAAYLPGLGSPAGFIEGALLRHHGVWHYGPSVRVLGLPSITSHSVLEGTIYNDVVMWLVAEAELTAGVQWAYDRLVVRGELAAGAAYVTLMSASNSWHYQTVGGRGGARLTIASQLFSSLWLEAGAGVDALLTNDESAKLDYLLGEDRLQAQGHVELGVVWSL